MAARWLLFTLLVLMMLPAPIPVESSVYVAPDLERLNPVRIYGQNVADAVFDVVSESRYKSHIIKLTENGSRWTDTTPTFSDANVYAKNWIVKRLGELSMDRIEVEVVGSHHSVVGRLPGWIPGDAPVIVIGGHYDSVPGAPGANDDGTGVATVLELAYVLSSYVWPLDIYFCAWNSEEIGLFGSREVATIFEQEGIEVLQYFNIDMLLVEDVYAPPDERVHMYYNNAEDVVYENSHYWADLTRMMSKNLGLDLIVPIPSTSVSFWHRSDHYSFIQRGYRNVLFAFESGVGYDDAYHQPTDTWDNPMYNYTLARETAASIGSTIAFSMSREYG
ncbi:MAG: M20/M25/M40 family metallo-hydrolase, partial [Candidatus Thorarchaeota archaeon]